jgi:broad specificity phosphatase PhoE
MSGRVPVGSDKVTASAVAWTDGYHAGKVQLPMQALPSGSFDDIAAEKNPAYPVGTVRKSIVAKRWQERSTPTHQFVGVLRHSERSDAPFAVVNGEYWHSSDDMKSWPLDPPLSDEGMVNAKKMGQHVLVAVQECSTEVHVVVSSPFLRCIQTAIEVCCALGPRTRLLVDYSLGEVYGPCVLQSTMEPQRTAIVRPMEHIRKLCRSRGVECEAKSIGQWPSWPENFNSARRRFAMRFLTYLRRSLRARRNFLIVSHADCVGASFSIMPCASGSVFEKVEYGGMFLAHRLLPTSLESFSRQVSPSNQSSASFHLFCRGDGDRISGGEDTDGEHAEVKVEPIRDKPSMDSISTVATSLSPQTSFEDLSSEAGWSSENSEMESLPSSLSTSEQFLRTPEQSESHEENSQVASHGWRLRCQGIQTRSGEDHDGTLQRRLKYLIDENFSQVLVEQLLATQLPNWPTGADAEVCRVESAGGACRDSTLSDPASLTNSTLVFGSSELPTLDATFSDTASLTNSTLVFGSSEPPTSPASMETEALGTCVGASSGASFNMLRNAVILSSVVGSRIARRRNLSL